MPNESFYKANEITVIDNLHHSKSPDEPTLDCTTDIPGTPTDWWNWASRMLLIIGGALVIIGIIFFFAYNWYEMGGFTKFAVLEFGIIACVIESHLHGGSKTISGKLMLLFASVLTGVLLAAYGQVYQTGADSYELFLGWAILIFGWVGFSRFAGLWVVWLIVLNTAVVLYWQQVGSPNHDFQFETLMIVLAAINGSALVLRETGLRRGLAWLSGGWSRYLLVGAVLFPLTIAITACVMTYPDWGLMSCLSVFLWFAAAVSGYKVFSKVIPDRTALVTIVSSLCFAVMSVFYRLSLEIYDYFVLREIFVAFSIVIVFSSAIVWLSRTTGAQREDSYEH